MTPEQRLIAKWVFILLLFVGTFFGGFYVRGYVADHDATVAQLELEKKHGAAVKEYLEKVDARDTQIALLQEQAYAKDVVHTKALNDAQAKNTALAGDLVVARRMRFNGAACPKQPTSTVPAEAGSLGDGAGVELTAAARQDVFNIRAGILTDQAKVRYLHDYSNTLLAWIREQRWCPQ